MYSKLLHFTKGATKSFMLSANEFILKTIIIFDQILCTMPFIKIVSIYGSIYWVKGGLRLLFRLNFPCLLYWCSYIVFSSLISVLYVHNLIICQDITCRFSELKVSYIKVRFPCRIFVITQCHNTRALIEMLKLININIL